MMRIPDVVVHLKDVEIDEYTRRSIERRCGQLAEEFHEVTRFELSVAEDGAGYSVHGHAVGKHTDIGAFRENIALSGDEELIERILAARKGARERGDLPEEEGEGPVH